MARSSRIYVAICRTRNIPVFANTVKYEFKNRLEKYPYPDELILWTIGDDKMQIPNQVSKEFFYER